MKRIACVLLALLSTVACAWAADLPDGRMYGPWRSSRIGGGGWVQQVANSPANPRRFYAYVDMAGIYRSDDNGEHWRMMLGGLPPGYGGYEIRGLLVDPRDADRILAAVGHHDIPQHRFGLYLSTDGGVTYTCVLDTLFVGNGVPHRDAGSILARHPQQPDVLLAGSFGEGLWRSEDNGKTWSNCGLKDLMFTDLRFDAADGNHVWACAQPWSGKVARQPRTLAGGFYESRDGGVSWAQVDEGSPTEIVQDSQDSQLLLGIFKNLEIRRSLDGGHSWEAFSQGLPVDLTKTPGPISTYTFTVLAAGPDFFLTGNRRGEIYRINRGETTWRRVERQAVDGKDWWGNPGHKPGWSHFGRAFGTLWIDPSDAAHWKRTDWYNIWTSHDSGANWEITNEGFEQTVVFKLEPNPADPRMVHLVMADNGYFRSDDGGKSFRRVDNGKLSSQLRDIVMSPASASRVYTVGASLNTAGEWVCNQLFVSSDAGMNWTPSPMRGIPDPTTHRCVSVAVDPADAERVWLGVSGPVKPGEGGPYLSTDGGQSFVWMGAGLPAEAEFFRTAFWSSGTELVALPGGKVLALSHAPAARGLYTWNPETQAWKQNKLPVEGAPVCFSADPKTPGRILLSMEGKGLFLSEDGGESWVCTFAKGVEQQAFDPVNTGVVAAMATGSDPGAIISHDGGRTWVMLDQKLPMRLGLTFAFANGRLLVGTHGAGVFELIAQP